MFDEPVHESAAVFYDLPVDAQLGVLDAGDERSCRGKIDLELFEANGKDLAGDLGDAGQKRLEIRAGATVRAVHETGGQERPQCGRSATPDCCGNLFL